MKPIHQNSRLLPILAALFLAAAAITTNAAGAADTDQYQKLTEYFRRKQNLPPDVAVKVGEVKDSEISGLKSATLELSRGEQKQTVQVLISADGRYAVFAEAEDVTKDPFAEIAKKLTTKGSPVRGPKDAKVTMVEFSDFQCPYCSKAHATVTQVLKDYGDKVRLVYKNYPLPFHKWAEAAGVAGACVFDQNEKSFWKLYDYYFENQQQMTPENIKEKTLEALKDDKLNKAKFDDCFDNRKTLDRVKADMAEGQSVGVSGTPAFIINGRTISGAQPPERFKAIIDDELARAK